MWLLLGIVAVAAAVFSFSALMQLAALCGFDARLGWLLPITIDAGAAAGCLVWLGRSEAHDAAGYARAMTLALLASSVAGNATVHALTAYRIVPPWWLVVAVSAVPPVVLGATVHLAVLVGRPDRKPTPVDSPDTLTATEWEWREADPGRSGRASGRGGRTGGPGPGGGAHRRGRRAAAVGGRVGHLGARRAEDARRPGERGGAVTRSAPGVVGR